MIINPYVFVATTPQYLLDLYPISTGSAYSVRKLRTAYTGACINVRRTVLGVPNSGTTVVSVFFDSNDTISFDSRVVRFTGNATLSTTLGQFMAVTGSGYSNVDNMPANQSGFVTQWYDQSGNNRHMTNITFTRQPRFVNNGVIETLTGSTNNRVTLNSNVQTQPNYLAITTANAFPVRTFFAVNKVGTQNGANSFAGGDPSGFTFTNGSVAGYNGIGVNHNGTIRSLTGETLDPIFAYINIRDNSAYAAKNGDPEQNIGSYTARTFVNVSGIFQKDAGADAT